jgi:uroporphyrinogen decarboxylase
MRKLTPKERVKIALEFKEPDRVPIQIYTTPEIECKLKDYFGGRDILDVFEVDFRNISVKWKGKIKDRIGDIWYDIWGVGYKSVKNPSGSSYNEACDLSLARIKTMDDFEKYPWPNVDDFDFSTIKQQCDLYKDFAICFGGAGMPDIVNGVGRGRGMEQVLMDIMLEDEVGMAIIDKRVEFYYEFCKRGLEVADGKIDILCVGEDCSTQQGRLFPPEVFEKVFVPRLKKFYDLAHEFGAKVMMHSCGDTHEIIPTFIDMGLDVLDAMQPEPVGMNPERLKKEYYGKLAFCGLISTQETLPKGTIEQCRAEARHRIDVIGKGGGYIFAPAHCIQIDTPIENVIAIYEEALGKSLFKSK